MAVQQCEAHISNKKKSRPLVVREGNRGRKLNVADSLLRAARSERTDWEAATCTDYYTHYSVVGSCLSWSEEDIKKTTGGRKKKTMESDSKRKMKERFGLRRDIFKEFLAEFLGIFVLIVSSLPPSAPVIQLKQPL